MFHFEHQSSILASAQYTFNMALFTFTSEVNREMASTYNATSTPNYYAPTPFMYRVQNLVRTEPCGTPV
jgi:hypothetical protein